MRRFLLYIVLLMHVNTYMFFPMIDETDQYECSGKQKDDINSLVEYINQVLMGHRDNTPEDEDDDQAHYYHIKSISSYVTLCEVHPHFVRPPYEPVMDALEYGTPTAPQLPFVSYDISGPPPKA